MASTRAMYGEQPAWEVMRPRFHAFRLLVAWVLSAAALLAAAWIVPGADVKNFGSALVAAAVIAALNAICRRSSRLSACRSSPRSASSCCSWWTR